MADVRMIDAGSLIGFQPNTVEAQKWLIEFVRAERRKHRGTVLYVDHRDATRICDGLFDYGLCVTV
jgi:hypothetical protein